MGKGLPLNRILIIVFIVVVLATGGLVFLLYSNQSKNSALPTVSPTSSTSVSELSTETIFSPDIRKVNNPSNDSVFYFMKVVLIDTPSFDPATGDAIGKFYFPNDPAKNIFNYSLTTLDFNKFYIGLYSTNFESKSSWKYRSKNELVNLAKSGVLAEMMGQFLISSKGSLDKVADIDSVFRSFRDSYGKSISIPSGFVFQAAQLGFVQE